MNESATEPRRAIEWPYVERVRFSWECKLETALANVIDVPGRQHEHAWEPPVRLTEASAPRVYCLAREVAETLGFAGRFVLFQTRTLDHVNARAFSDEDPVALGLIGPAISLLDDAALRAMIGHEFGHCLAHGIAISPDSRVLRLAHADTGGGALVRNACSVAGELTADRFALLACQDLAAAVRLEVVSSTLISAESLGLREDDYLADVCNQVVEGEVAKVNETHPSLEFRLYANWLFSRSDEYWRLTGRGSADMTLAEVDDRLEGMLVTSELESALVAIAAKPVASKQVRRREPPRPCPPAAASPSPFDAALIKERLIRGARRFVGDLAGRAQRPSKPPRQTEPLEARAPEAPRIDSDPLEACFRSLERTKLEELERRFEELERKAAKRDGSK